MAGLWNTFVALLISIETLDFVAIYYLLRKNVVICIYLGWFVLYLVQQKERAITYGRHSEVNLGE